MDLGVEVYPKERKRTKRKETRDETEERRK